MGAEKPVLEPLACSGERERAVIKKTEPCVRSRQKMTVQGDSGQEESYTTARASSLWPHFTLQSFSLDNYVLCLVSCRLPPYMQETAFQESHIPPKNC